MQNTSERTEGCEGTLESRILELYPRLIGFFRKRKNSFEAPEDLAQETMLRIFRRIDSFDPNKASLFTWMCRIGMNLVIDLQRKQRAAPIVFSRSVEAEYRTDEQQLEVNEMLDSLIPERAAILHSLYVKGFSERELAREESLPLHRIKYLKARALNKLKEDFADDEPMTISMTKREINKNIVRYPHPAGYVRAA